MTIIMIKKKEEKNIQKKKMLYSFLLIFDKSK